jgi:hypothetical protein
MKKTILVFAAATALATTLSAGSASADFLTDPGNDPLAGNAQWWNNPGMQEMCSKDPDGCRKGMEEGAKGGVECAAKAAKQLLKGNVTGVITGGAKDLICTEEKLQKSMPKGGR